MITSTKEIIQLFNSMEEIIVMLYKKCRKKIIIIIYKELRQKIVNKTKKVKTLVKKKYG